MEKRKVTLGFLCILIGIGMIYIALYGVLYGKRSFEGILLLVAFLGGGVILIGGGWEYATGMKIPLPEGPRKALTHLIMMLVGAGLTISCGGAALLLLIYEPSTGKFFAVFLGLGFLVGLVLLYMSVEPIIERFRKRSRA